jgi:hypothetical protein
MPVTLLKNSNKSIPSPLIGYYINQTVDISMPNYVAKALQRFDHVKPTLPQTLPHIIAKPQYGVKMQLTLHPDNTPRLSTAQVTHLQQVIGTLL